MYSTAVSVIEYTGVRPKDLSCDTSAELTTLVESWLLEIKSIIDSDRKRDFLSEAGGNVGLVPPLVHNVAKRMCSNMVALAVLRRDTPIVKLNDFAVQLVSDQILTEEIKRDLSLIPRGSVGSFPLRMWRIRSAREIEESE